MRAWVWGLLVLVACGPSAELPAPAVPAQSDADVLPSQRTAEPAPMAPELALRRTPLAAYACVPRTCAELRMNCGAVDDGCGGTLECGSCSEAMSCTSRHVCMNPNARFTQVSAADDGGCGIMNDRTLWCWTRSSPPLQVGDESDWSFVAKAEGHACAIKLDRSLWCWGYNHAGQLGIGSMMGFEATPRQVVGNGSWLTVAVHGDKSCGLRTDGTLWCWGVMLTVGSVGDPAQVSTPALVSSDGHWRSLSIDEHFVCTIDHLGGLDCWRLGYDKVQFYVVHEQHPSTWRQFSGSCGIRFDGTLWCRGPGSLEQRGTATDWSAALPGPVMLKTDRSLWSWGLQGAQRVGAAAWLDVSVSTAYGCGVRTDGATWCWNDPAQPTQIHP